MANIRQIYTPGCGYVAGTDSAYSLLKIITSLRYFEVLPPEVLQGEGLGVISQGRFGMYNDIGLSDEQRQGAINLLSVLLADEYVLYTKTRNYHWNVVGPQFRELHKLFEEQYKELNAIVDEMAERVRVLGGPAIGTLAEFAQRTRLKEHPGHYPEAHEMLSDLQGDHATVIRHIRSDAEMCAEEYQDMGTHDFLIGVMLQHEKIAWMLRAFLEGKSV